MKIISQTPEKLILRMPANVSLANAIRRSTDEILVLAIDEVEILKNDSALYDEVLAHRLGLIPFKSDAKATEKSEFTVKLSKTGPCTIYSGDLKGEITPVHDKIPITILEKGQELEFVATIRAGNGLEHAKFSPALCYYRHLLEIKSKNPEVAKIIETSSGLIPPEKVGDKTVCDISDAAITEVEGIDKESIQDSEEILYFIESWGQIEAQSVLLRSISALKDNIKEFEKAIKSK